MANDLKAALESLVGATAGWSPLEKIPPVGRRPGSIGVGSAAGTSAGSDSFVEEDYAAREHYAERVLRTSDGVFSIAWKPTKRLFGKGGTTIELKEPT